MTPARRITRRTSALLLVCALLTPTSALALSVPETSPSSPGSSQKSDAELLTTASQVGQQVGMPPREQPLPPTFAPRVPAASSIHIQAITTSKQSVSADLTEWRCGERKPNTRQARIGPIEGWCTYLPASKCSREVRAHLRRGPITLTLMPEEVWSHAPTLSGTNRPLTRSPQVMTGPRTTVRM